MTQTQQLTNQKIIVLNPDEADRLDYEHNWKKLISFDDYISIKIQKATFENNEKGYQRVFNVKP
jgi:hypothetical protein